MKNRQGFKTRNKAKQVCNSLLNLSRSQPFLVSLPAFLQGVYHTLPCTDSEMPGCVLQYTGHLFFNVSKTSLTWQRLKKRLVKQK